MASSRACCRKELPTSELEAALRFACKVGSRVCTQVGAVAALPCAGELDAPLG
jgi:sugar/nucleoside kinase (ribokinase family)